MKSIWLPLALVAGSFGSASAQPLDLATDEAIQQAKLELEQARVHLEKLVAEQAAQDALAEKLKVAQLAQDARIQWATAAEAPCEGEAKVVTKAFKLGDGATCDTQGDCEETQSFTISLDGASLDLGGVIADALVVDGGGSGYQKVDLGEGRTMVIQVEAMDLSDSATPHMVAFAPDADLAWGVDCEVEVDCEVPADCGSSCESSCESDCGSSCEVEQDVQVYTLGGPMGGGGGGMMFGGGPMKAQKSKTMVFGMGGEGHAGFPMGMHGGHPAPQAFGVFHGKGGKAFGHGGHGGADFDFRGQGRTHKVMIQVDLGNPQWIEIPCEPQGFDAHHAPRAPQAFFGRRMMQNRPMFLGMDAHGGHGGTWFESHDGEHDAWLEVHAGDHGDAWSGEWVFDHHEVASDCCGDCDGDACDAGASSCEEANECEKGVQWTTKGEPHADFFLGTVDSATCESACGGCDSSDCGDCTATCDSAAPACDSAKDCGDCDGSDCGDCAATCESEAPVATGAFFIDGGDVDLEIEALIAELEDVPYGEGVHVIELHAEADGEYDEIEALIAEIEAELGADLGSLGYVDEPVLVDVEIMDHHEIDEKQERIDELEAEVSELRELVESLVKELNQR